MRTLTVDMHLFSAFFLLFFALDTAPEPVVLEAPDSAFSERLAWAQGELADEPVCTTAAECDDVAIRVLALNSLGRFELARPVLVRSQARTPLWIVASFDYWLVSADQAFVREQWPFVVAPDRARDGGVLLAAVNALAVLARVRDDSATAARAAMLLAEAERRAQQSPGVFAPALGLVNADHADAHLSFLADTVHARWPLASGLVALAFYEYHRAADGFALLRNMAHREVSSAAMFVLPMLRGLIGWEVDAPNRAIAIEPHLPAEWSSLSASNLRVGTQDVDVVLQRESRVYRVQLSKEGNTTLSIRVSPALPLGSRITGVTVNEADVPIQVEETAHDTHVVIETSLRREVEIEIEYVAPRPRRSP